MRDPLDDIFQPEQRCGVIAFKKTGFASAERLSTTHDFLLWYARSTADLRFRPVYGERDLTPDELGFYDYVELPDGSRRRLDDEEKALGPRVRELGRVFARNPMVSPGWQESLSYKVQFAGHQFEPPRNRHWATHHEGMERIRDAKRLAVKGNTLRFVRYFDDFALQPLGTVWNDTGVGGFVGDERLYVVQTDTRVVLRCILMTTDPGDLVVDPTCGSGTTAYVAEQWGRRWITIDTSRVPLALARQRVLTATFPWYELDDEARGPAAGFVYRRKQNNKGEEVGGIVPHVTLKSIANNEPPEEEVLVDRPEKDDHITRVSGAFCVEATVPTPVELLEADQADTNSGSERTDSGMTRRGEATTPTRAGADSGSQIADSGSRIGAGLGSRMADSGMGPIAESTGDHGTFVDRMLEILRKSPVLRLAGNSTVTLRNIKLPAKTLSLSAEALVEGSGKGNGGGNGKGDSTSHSPAPGSARRAAIEDSQIRDSGSTPGHVAIRDSGTTPARAANGKIRADDREPQTDDRQPATAPVALVFGPENGAVSERLVQEAAREAYLKSYTHLYVIGFAIQPHARQLVENCEAVIGIPATYVQATPDLMMGDLLKNMRSSQIFSVCGLPEIKVHRVGKGDSAASQTAADAGLRMADGGFRSKKNQTDSAGSAPWAGQAGGAGSRIADSGFQSAKQVDSGLQTPQQIDSGFQGTQYQVELLGAGRIRSHHHGKRPSQRG
ncbi:MAG TPA: DNA methyltransferase [Terriglobia bacterium]|nr:DNA methyltransferase [Terriglobia bacterium]